MMRVLILAGLLVASPVAAQETRSDTTPMVVAVGQSRVARAPDYGQLSIDVRGEGDTQIEALAALEAERARVSDGLSQLEGATLQVLQADSARIGVVTSGQCEDDRYAPRRSTGACATAGYVASISMIARIAPAERLGEALSLAAELGSSRVQVERWGVNDQQALLNDAARAAFANAQAEAELVAAASGGRIGRIIRIQDGSSSAPTTYDGLVSQDEVVISGTRVRATVPLAVAPEPVEATASMTVVFALEPRI